MFEYCGDLCETAFCGGMLVPFTFRVSVLPTVLSMKVRDSIEPEVLTAQFHSGTFVRRRRHARHRCSTRESASFRSGVGEIFFYLHASLLSRDPTNSHPIRVSPSAIFFIRWRKKLKTFFCLGFHKWVKWTPPFSEIYCALTIFYFSEAVYYLSLETDGVSLLISLRDK